MRMQREDVNSDGERCTDFTDEDGCDGEPLGVIRADPFNRLDPYPKPF
jgi:hypothetical protein